MNKCVDAQYISYSVVNTIITLLHQTFDSNCSIRQPLPGYQLNTLCIYLFLFVHQCIHGGDSMDPFTPKPLTVLSQQKDYVGRIVHTTTNGLQILHLYLQPDSLTEQLLNELRKTSTFRVELLCK